MLITIIWRLNQAGEGVRVDQLSMEYFLWLLKLPGPSLQHLPQAAVLLWFPVCSCCAQAAPPPQPAFR